MKEESTRIRQSAKNTMEDRTSEQTRQNSWKNKMEAKMAEIVLK